MSTFQHLFFALYLWLFRSARPVAVVIAADGRRLATRLLVWRRRQTFQLWVTADVVVVAYEYHHKTPVGVVRQGLIPHVSMITGDELLLHVVVTSP